MDMLMKKKRQTVARQPAALGPPPELPKELLDQLVKGPMTPAEVQNLMLAFNKAVIERAMGAEMNLRLGYPAGQSKPPGQANERNGASGKTVITDRGPVRVNVPRDRDGSFESILIPKHERRFTGVDERIIAMYGRGVSVREIQGFLAEHYGTEVSPAFISSVTDEVMAEASSWQNAGASEERLAYDPSGRLIDAVNRYSRVQFFFDPVGNLVREHMDDHYCCNYQNRK